MFRASPSSPPVDPNNSLASDPDVQAFESSLNRSLLSSSSSSPLPLPLPLPSSSNHSTAFPPLFPHHHSFSPSSPPSFLSSTVPTATSSKTNTQSLSNIHSFPLSAHIYTSPSIPLPPFSSPRPPTPSSPSSSSSSSSSPSVDIPSLRLLISNCHSSCQYDTSVFYSDKLLTIVENIVYDNDIQHAITYLPYKDIVNSNTYWSDLLLYGRSLLLSHQYKRCIYSLKEKILYHIQCFPLPFHVNSHDNNNNVSSPSYYPSEYYECMIFLCQSYIECKEYEEGIQTMGAEDDMVVKQWITLYNNMQSGGNDDDHSMTDIPSSSSSSLLPPTLSPPKRSKSSKIPFVSANSKTGKSLESAFATPFSEEKKGYGSGNVSIHMNIQEEDMEEEKLSFPSSSSSSPSSPSPSASISSTSSLDSLLSLLHFPPSQPPSPLSLHLCSSLSSLRAKCYAALSNRPKSLYFHKLSLIFDSKNTSSFYEIIDNKLLSISECILMYNKYVEPSIPQSQFVYLKNIYENKIYSTLFTTQTNVRIQNNMEILENNYLLSDNDDLSSMIADNLYQRYEYEKCYFICKNLIKKSPYYTPQIIILYINCCMELQLLSELFYLSHQLIREYHDKSIALYSIGCYYLAHHKYEFSRRFLHKSIRVSPSSPHSWLAYGHAFAAEDDSDQAISSYRAAARLFEGGHHLPFLYLSVEYNKMNQFSLSTQFLHYAHSLHPYDTNVIHEIGVNEYRKGNYGVAMDYMLQSLQFIAIDGVAAGEGGKEINANSTESSPSFLPTVVGTESLSLYYINIGHCYRKLKEYSHAIEYYQKSLTFHPHSHTIHAAIGFSYHLKGEVEKAIQWYHSVLSKNPKDAMVGELINKAMEEMAMEGLGMEELELEESEM